MKRAAASIAGLGILAGAVAAQPAQPAIGYEDAAVLAGTCFGCHGPEGGGVDPIPRIAGMPADRMIALFAAFAAGELPGATIMERIVFAYDDGQVAAIARYFAGWDAP